MNDLVPSSEITFASPEGPEGSGENPLLLIHRHLRGRYKLALILAVVLAVPLAAVGYLILPPVYASTGMVRVAPQIQMMIYKDMPEAAVPPFFESFVGTQAAMITSRRVFDMALADPKLRAAGWPGGNDGLILLNKTLEVSNRHGTELIVATVRNKSPEMAQAAVNAVLDAYDKVREESSSVTISDKENALRERQTQLTHDLDIRRGWMSDLTSRYGADDVEELHLAKLGAVVQLDTKIQSIDFALSQKDGAEGGATVPVPADLSDLELGLSDPAFFRLKEQEQSIALELDRMGKSLRPEHREMKQMQQRYDAVHLQVEDARQKLLAMPHNDVSASVVSGAMTVDQLKAQRERYSKLRETTSADAVRLAQAKLSLASYKDQMADIKRNLDETNKMLDQIHTENRSLQAGRVSIMQRGDLPLEASTDRRKVLAVVGALGGGALGIGLVLMVGLVRGGFRYIDELERAEASVPLLGTVPDLKSADAEHESMAALSVHHLRNILQLQFERSPGGKVFTITSAAAGDGKTSLALALAMSFAATGRRTLIVDADLVGRGMTRQLEMAGIPGLCDALRADKINGDIHPTKVASLKAMPAGVVQGFVPEHLSAATMGRIIKELRTQYDAIVLDTGPILGSLEANVMAPISDGVVVVVSRGQSAKSVRASIQRLRRLGAPCAGLIFNRASTHDFDHSLSTASVSARSVRASAQAARRGGVEERAALMRAVAAPGAPDGKEAGAA